MINVETFELLKALPSPEEGEYGIVEEEQKVYQYKDGEWQLLKVSGEGIKMTLADLNQSIMASLPALDDKAWKKGKKKIDRFVKKMADKYYALISFEHHYITLFYKMQYTTYDRLLTEIYDVIEEIGEIKDVSNNGHGAVEIWITDGDRTNCFLLFPYSKGVIEV